MPSKVWALLVWGKFAKEQEEAVYLNINILGFK